MQLSYDTGIVYIALVNKKNLSLPVELSQFFDLWKSLQDVDRRKFCQLSSIEDRCQMFTLSIPSDRNCAQHDSWDAARRAG